MWWDSSRTTAHSPGARDGTPVAQLGAVRERRRAGACIVLFISHSCRHRVIWNWTWSDWPKLLSGARSRSCSTSGTSPHLTVRTADNLVLSNAPTVDRWLQWRAARREHTMPTQQPTLPNSVDKFERCRSECTRGCNSRDLLCQICEGVARSNGALQSAATCLNPTAAQHYLGCCD